MHEEGKNKAHVQKETELLKKTKIICTIGPASLSRRILKKMYRAGMNGARINTAYGNLEQFKLIIENMRETADIPVIIDIKGPEIRLQAAQKKPIKKGDVIEVGFSNEKISFNHNIYSYINVSDNIYIDNGKIRTQVTEKANRKLRLSVMSDGEISDGKGVNIPNKQLPVPTLSKKDRKIVKFANKNGVEYIALSFARNAQDVRMLKSITQGSGSEVIAKIENSQGLKNLVEILDNAGGIMVARGDLGVEIEPERVPIAQKSIIKTCNQEGKIVVTATEMLESMIYQPTPTRAEVSDVANAILDGTDAVMLSGETSIGKYPVEAVSMMTRIAKKTEKIVKSQVENGKFINISDTVSKAIQRLCQTMPVNKIVTLTRSGYTARMISRLKVAPVIIAVTPHMIVKKQLELVFGILPVHIDYREEKDRILATAKKLRSMNLLADDDIVIFNAASRTVEPHASNLIEIHKIQELVEAQYPTR
jgi:pyruvate kinase